MAHGYMREFDEGRDTSRDRDWREEQRSTAIGAARTIADGATMAARAA